MNVPLLLKIKEKILSTSQQFDMNDWFKDVDGCVTTACIAGWAIKLSPISKRDNDSFNPAYTYTENIAVDLLQLPSICLSDVLFYADYWPEKFKSALSLTDAGTPEYAKITADYIDYYIATYA